MAWVTPAFTKSQVDKAGHSFLKAKTDSLAYTHAVGVINNWRASHQYPLNSFQLLLRRKAKQCGGDYFVSQRIKRLESIHRKLASATMSLTQMQDIGGCRAVTSKIEEVYRLKDLFEESRFDHEFKNEKDYIYQPKDDGYRGIHLIYKFRATRKKECYNGLKVEIQIRSQLQHAWATAVEAVGTFTKQALKWKGGDADWRRFFVIMGCAMAKIEDRPLVSGMPTTKRDIGMEIRKLTTALRVQDTLRAYSLTMSYIGELKASDAKILLLHMVPDQSKLEVRGFRLRESQQANDEYTDLERSIRPESSAQAVLVRVDSLQALQRAYPNYFLDTERFNSLVSTVRDWR